MEKGIFCILINPNILATFPMINLMVMDYFNTELSTISETFKMELCMEMDFGKIKKGKNTSVNGKQIKPMAMVSM